MPKTLCCSFNCVYILSVFASDIDWVSIKLPPPYYIQATLLFQTVVVLRYLWTKEALLSNNPFSLPPTHINSIWPHRTAALPRKFIGQYFRKYCYSDRHLEYSERIKLEMTAFYSSLKKTKHDEVKKPRTQKLIGHHSTQAVRKPWNTWGSVDCVSVIQCSIM